MSQARVAHSVFRVGQLVKRSSLYPSARIKVSSMKLDKYLLMYFAESKHYWAETKDLKCDVGDIVLIKAMNKETYPQTTFEIVDVIFKEGGIHGGISKYSHCYVHSKNPSVDEYDLAISLTHMVMQKDLKHMWKVFGTNTIAANLAWLRKHPD